MGQGIMAKDHDAIDTRADPFKELNTKLDTMEDNGMERTREWAAMWQENLRYYFSDQLHGKRKHKNWTWIIINYIWPSVIQEIAKLSANHPKIIASPWEDSDAEAAETWQNHLQFLWQKGINGHGMRLEQIAAILDGKLFGYRVSKVFWEEKNVWDDEKKESGQTVRRKSTMATAARRDTLTSNGPRPAGRSSQMN
jgi:hypothetical protein